LGVHGRAFPKVGGGEGEILLERMGEIIMDMLTSNDGSLKVVPFRRDKETWSSRWKLLSQISMSSNAYTEEDRELPYH